MNEKLNPIAAGPAALCHAAGNGDTMRAAGVYQAHFWEVLDEHLVAAQRVLAKLVKAMEAPAWQFWRKRSVARLQVELNAFPRRLARTVDFPNLVPTLGKNYLLDNGMAGSAFTATYYMGLISSTSYSTIVAGDTAASHAGWLEAGATNAPAYSQSARPTCAWSAASAGSKSLSSALTFTFTSSGTVKGSFLSTIATKDSTSGTLFSAGLFTGGDQPVVATNVVTVTYTLGL